MIDVKNKLRKPLALTVTFFAFILLWNLVSRSGFININLFPPPDAVWNALIEMAENRELFSDISASLIRLFIGFAIGTSLGIIAGLITAKANWFKESFGQLINFFRFIPPIALIPLAILWLGIGEQSKIGLILLAVFFPVWINTTIGVANVNQKHIRAAKSLGISNIRLLKEVIIPSATPFIIAGARIGIGIAFSVLIAAEMAGAFSGLGFRISISHQVFRVDKMLADIIVLGILGLIADRLFLLLTKKLIPWEQEQSK